MIGEPWDETAAGTGAGATATHAAVAGSTHVITSVSGHTDADATLQIKDDTAVVWEGKIDISIEGTQLFPVPPKISATAGNAVSAVISASTADCQVNVSGYTLL